MPDQSQDSHPFIDSLILYLRFRVQVGVVNELGSKIDSQLRSLESKLFSANGNLATNMSRTEAAQYRATHVKLTRDFRSVETKCKKLLLEAKRKRDYLEAQKRNKVLEEQEREQQKKDSLNSGDALLRVQMQEDVSFHHTLIFIPSLILSFSEQFLLLPLMITIANCKRNNERAPRRNTKHQ